MTCLYIVNMTISVGTWSQWLPIVMRMFNNKLYLSIFVVKDIIVIKVDNLQLYGSMCCIYLLYRTDHLTFWGGSLNPSHVKQKMDYFFLDMKKVMFLQNLPKFLVENCRISLFYASRDPMSVYFFYKILWQNIFVKKTKKRNTASVPRSQMVIPLT